MIEELQPAIRWATAVAQEPGNLESWWYLAGALGDAGETKLAEGVWEKLAHLATTAGRASLAVACAVELKERGEEERAQGILGQVGTLYCKGNAVAWELRVPTMPPVPRPPSNKDASPETSFTGRAALSEAVSELLAHTRKGTASAVQPVRGSALLESLTATQFQELVKHMGLVSVSAGQVVISQGDAADDLYWLVCGTVEVSRGDSMLGTLYPGSFFGEIALVENAFRTAEVKCTSDCVFLVCSASTIGELALEADGLAKTLAGYARARLVTNVLRTSGLFSKLTTEQRQRLLTRFSLEHHVADEVVIGKGTDNDSLFVVVSGLCHVMDKDSFVAALHPGMTFGEMSMLGRKPASFDVVVVSDAVVLRIRRESFDDIVSEHPELLAQAYELLVQREKENRTAKADDPNAEPVYDASELVL